MKGEIWRAAIRSAYEFRRLITPLPEVMDHLIRLNTLRKSVWSIINESVGHGADLTATSLRCRLYAGLYTPDIQRR